MDTGLFLVFIHSVIGGGGRSKICHCVMICVTNYKRYMSLEQLVALGLTFKFRHYNIIQNALKMTETLVLI